MTGQQIMVWASVILSTLSEMDGGWGPRSSIYMAMGCDYDNYLAVEAAIEKMGWVKKDANTIRLTETGMAKAQQINNYMNKV